MAFHSFACENCHNQFSTDVIEGKKVKCFSCKTLIDVPIRDGLHEVYARNYKETIEPYEKAFGKNDRIVRRSLESWQILCHCPRCKVRYITAKEHMNKIGLCSNCDYNFSVEGATALSAPLPIFVKGLIFWNVIIIFFCFLIGLFN